MSDERSPSDSRHQKISVICIDRKGEDYGDLPDMLGEDWLHLSVHDGMRLGLKAPLGVPANVWTNIVATLFAACVGLISSWVTFANVIRWLLTAMNESPTDVLLWPDWQLILDVLSWAPQTLWSEKSEYSHSLKQYLRGIVQASGDLFRTFSGIDFEQDIISNGKSVVIDMANLFPTWLRVFVVYLIVAQILFGRIHRHQRTDTTEVLLVLDEADQDVSRKLEEAFGDGLSPIALLPKQGRGFGIALCLGLSRLDHASPFVLSNVQYHIVGNTSDSRSVLEAKRTLMLPPGAEAQLPALQPGEAILREAQGAWSHPMWVKIDYVPPCPGSAHRDYDTHPFIPAKRLHEMPHVMEALEKLIAESRRAKLRQAQAKQSDISENARKLLDLVSIQVYVPAARLWEQIGKVSPSAQANARKELEERGVAYFEEERIGRRNVLMLEPTPQGWEYLGKTPPKAKGRGGLVHRHFAAWLKAWAEKQGHKTETEWVAPGTTHPADCAHKKDSDKWAVFECVVTSKDNIIDHLEACFIRSDAVATVTIVAPRKAVLQRLEKQVATHPSLTPFQDRIHYEPMERYMKELWP